MISYYDIIVNMFMLTKFNIVDKTIQGFLRIFKIQNYVSNARNVGQFHSGGDDYNPPAGIEVLGSFVNNDPKNGVVVLYRDRTPRKAAPGEKRLYAVDSENNIVAELHLKNNGVIDIVAQSDVNIVATGNATVSAQTLTVSASQTILGSGGKAIARVGDSVEVDPGTHKGTITSGGTNTSV